MLRLRPLLALLLALPLSAQVRQETPEPLLSAHTISLQNGGARASSGSAADPSALPPQVFEHLLQAFTQWSRYQVVQPRQPADLVAIVNLTALPDHRLNLRILNPRTSFTVWQRSINIKASGDPDRNLDHCVNFLMLRLKTAVNHPPPDKHLIVP